MENWDFEDYDDWDFEDYDDWDFEDDYSEERLYCQFCKEETMHEVYPTGTTCTICWNEVDYELTENEEDNGDLEIT